MMRETLVEFGKVAEILEGFASAESGGADADPVEADAWSGLLIKLKEAEDTLANIRLPMDILLSAPEHFRDSATEISGRIAGFFDSVEGDVNEVKNDLEELGERIPELLKEKWDELGGCVEEMRELMVESAEESWRDAVHEATDAWTEALEEIVEAQKERFTEIGDKFRETVEEALESLKDFAEDELSDAVKEQIQKLLDAAVERLEQEVMDGVMSSQIQVQLTSAMAPILPQLMVVRIVAGTIKQALEILRMGF